jgi:hypothetical protein
VIMMKVLDPVGLTHPDLVLPAAAVTEALSR